MNGILWKRLKRRYRIKYAWRWVFCGGRTWTKRTGTGKSIPLRQMLDDQERKR